MPDVVTNITEPPDFLKPYYAALAERGMNLGNLGFTPYGGQRVADFNDQQQAAAQMIQTRALAGSPLNYQAQDFAQTAMAGGLNIAPGSNPYSGSNPYLNNAINQAQNDVTGRIDSKFNNNAFGGTAHQQTLGRELGNISNNMRMQDYGMQQQLAENAINRGMQAQQFNVQTGFNAMGAAGGLANQDYVDAGQLMNLGIGIQDHNQRIADANYGEFMRQQDWPSQQLAWMQAGINPSASAFRNQTQSGPSQGSNSFANVVGGIGAIGGLGKMFDWW